MAKQTPVSPAPVRPVASDCMFENLSDRLDGIFKRLRGKGRLTEADVDEVLREIRTALLEADVNVGVVRDVVARIREQAIGADAVAGARPEPAGHQDRQRRADRASSAARR